MKGNPLLILSSFRQFLTLLPSPFFTVLNTKAFGQLLKLPTLLVWLILWLESEKLHKSYDFALVILMDLASKCFLVWFLKISDFFKIDYLTICYSTHECWQLIEWPTRCQSTWRRRSCAGLRLTRPPPTRPGGRSPPHLHQLTKKWWKRYLLEQGWGNLSVCGSLIILINLLRGPDKRPRWARFGPQAVLSLPLF